MIIEHFCLFCLKWSNKPNQAPQSNTTRDTIEQTKEETWSAPCLISNNGGNEKPELSV